MDMLQNYTGYLRSRFSIDTSNLQEKKIKDFIAAQKLPKSVYFELRMREMDKRLIQTKALEDTLKKMVESRRMIEHWNLPTHLQPITKTLKIYTKSAGAVSYVVDKYKKTHLFIVMYTPERQVVAHLGETFRISDCLCLATTAAHLKDMVLSNQLNNDSRFPTANGWPHTNFEIGLAIPIMKSNEEVLAVIELTKVVFSTEYSFIDISAASLITSLLGYLAEESETVSEIQMSLTFINPMMKLITQYLEATLPVASIISQLTFMNRNELGAEKSSFSVMKYIRERKFNMTYTEEPGNPHCHIETSSVLSEKDESLLGRSMKSGEILRKEEKNKQRWLIGLPIKFNEATGGMQFQFISIREPSIDEKNQKILEITCTFLGFILELHELGDTLFKHEREIILIEDMLRLQTCQCSHELEKLKLSVKTFRSPEHIFSYNWSPDKNITDEQNMVLLTNFIYSRIGHIFQDVPTLINFLLFVRRMHLHHNEIFYSHIIVSVHFIITFLKKNDDWFSRFEKDVLMIAAVCHRLHSCNPSYCDIFSAIFQMFAINKKISKLYINEIVAKVKKWKLLFPCNYRPDGLVATQKKYLHLLHLFRDMKFNNQNKFHRELIILAIIINADECMYYKNKAFMSYHDEYSYIWDIVFNKPGDSKILNPQAKVWTAKVVAKRDKDKYENHKRLAVNMIRNFVQPWLNILKTLFDDTEYLQCCLDQSVRTLRKQEIEIREEKRKTFFLNNVPTIIKKRIWDLLNTEYKQ